MRTIKLVVLGSSGVGKTSVRTQYISGRFSIGYRATIGADFITKAIPHPTRPEEEGITLQIWDTAGQERFSSLSSAFFRGADAAMFVFDVGRPQTLDELAGWWTEFKDKAPLRDEDVEQFCAVVVGNKIDVIEGGVGGEGVVTAVDAKEFLLSMIPAVECHSPNTSVSPLRLEIPLPTECLSPPNLHTAPSNTTAEEIPIPFPRPRTRSIDIDASSPPGPSSGRARVTSSFRGHSRSIASSARLYGGAGTSSSSTAQTVYHTPSSSYFDTFSTARTSTAPALFPSTRSASAGSDASSGVTMTPSLFARQMARDGTNTGMSDETSQEPPFRRQPDVGPRLFWASAKTGEGVEEVFEYVARRVVARWEWEEAVESQLMRTHKGSTGDTIRVGLANGTAAGAPRTKRWGCCG